MKRRNVVAGLLLTAVATLGVSAQPVSAQSAKVLKVTGFLPKDDVNMTAFRAFLDKFNAKAAGKLELRWIGGPEAVPALKQFDALKGGIVDMIFAAESYYGQSVTGAPYTHLTKRTPEEERTNGYVAYRSKLLSPHNVVYLGRGEYGPWFHVFTNKPVKKLEDLKGQRIRVSGTYAAFMNALGAVPITLPGSEIYSALDRHVIDGYAWSVLGNMSSSWHEKVTQVLAPRLFNMNVEVLVNKTAWDGLTPELRTLLEETMAENEREYTSVMRETSEKEYAALVAAGVKPVDLSPEDTKKYVDLAYDSQWKLVEKAAPAEVVAKLQELFGR